MRENSYRDEDMGAVKISDNLEFPFWLSVTGSDGNSQLHLHATKWRVKGDAMLYKFNKPSINLA